MDEEIIENNQETKPDSLTPEQAKVLEDILNNREKLNMDATAFDIFKIFRNKEFKSKNLNEADLKLFWQVFGWVPNMAWNEIIGGTLRAIGETVGGVGMAPEGEEPLVPIEVGMSYSQWTNMISYSLGIRYQDLEPSVQEGFDMLYEITPPEELKKIANAADYHHNLMIEAVLAGNNPPEVVINIEDASVELLSDYSDQADLAYKAYISKDARDTIYKEVALKNSDENLAEDLLLKLQNNEINSQQYLDSIEAALTRLDVDVEGFLNAMTGGEIGPQTELTTMIDDEYLRIKAFSLGADNYYGLGDVDLQGPVYSDTDKIPLYEYGLARQLFANASAEEIMEVQLMLVEAGFLKPFSFVYGLLDNNDGGTIQALESAMSRFNLNGDAVTREDLIGIMLAPGAKSQNLTVFVKEFLKDTLEDYAFGTGKFEASDTYGVNYNDVFTYIKPNFNNAKSTIAAAIEKGLGRPASSSEIQAYVDYINKLSYDLQKENYDINQRNINRQLAAERNRQAAALSGNAFVNDVELEQPLSAEGIGQAIYTGFNDFVNKQYGGLLEGNQQAALYNNAFITMLNSMSNLGRYSTGNK